jgi:hypothetical protein
MLSMLLRLKELRPQEGVQPAINPRADVW